MRRTLKPTNEAPPPAPNELKGTGLISERANEYYLFLISDIARRKKTERVKPSQEKTAEERYNTLKDFLSVCKLEHVDLNHVGPTHAAEYRRSMQAAEYSKSYINKRVSFLKVFFDQMRQDAYYFHPNPFEAQRLRIKQSETKGRDCFTPDDIELIFSKTWYKATEVHRARVRPSFKWIPAMLLYTGCNPEEIASLPMKHVKKTKSGRYTIYIDRDYAKTDAREQLLPLAKELVERYRLGEFLDQRLTESKDPEERLFLDLSTTKNGYNHDAAKRFNELMAKMRKAEVLEGNKTLVCFRHTLINNLKNKNINDGLSRAISGHSQISDTHSNSYQKDKAHGTFEAIEKILDDQSYELEYFK